MAQRFPSPLNDRPAPLSLNYNTYDAFLAAGQEAGSTNPVASIYKSIELFNARRTDATEVFSLEDQQQRIDEAKLTGRLMPSEGETEESFDLLIDYKREEVARKAVLANAPDDVSTSAATLGAGLFVSMLDPLNVASAFVPVVSSARYAAMLSQRASTFGRLAVRSRAGAAEGFVGAAAVEPLVYFAAQDRQADYKVYDSFANLAFGTVLGGGLHGVGGFVKDKVSPPITAQNVVAGIDQASAEARESAFRAGIGQLASGRKVVGVDYILRADLENSTAIDRFFDPRTDLDIGEAVETSILRINEGGPEIRVKAASGLKNERVAKRERERLEKSDLEIKTTQADDGTYQLDVNLPSEIIAKNPEGGFLSFRNKKAANKARTRLQKEGIIENGTAVKIGDDWFIVQTKDQRILKILAENGQNIVLPTEFPSINISRAASEQVSGERIIPDVDYGTDQILKAHSSENLIFANQERVAREAVRQDSARLFDDLDEATARQEIDETLVEVEQLKTELADDELLAETIDISEQENIFADVAEQNAAQSKNAYTQAAACVLKGFG